MRTHIPASTLPLALSGLLVAAVAAPSVALGAEVDLPRFPSISPDGERIAFSWRGDVWTAPAQGGEAARLTSHEGLDLRSAWSPDGQWLAFDSDRGGYLNLYVIGTDGADLRQVTFSDTGCTLTAFGEGGRILTFDAYREGDIYREPRPYSVAVAGGPVRRLHDAFGRAPVVSSDGKRVLFTRGGSSWSRRHYRGSGNRDLWLQHREAGSFRRLTRWAGNDGQARWQDERHAVFLSDRELDTVNLWRLDTVTGETARLTGFEERDVRHVDVAADGSRAVFVAWDRIYTLDLRSAGAMPVPLTITAPRDEGDPTFLKDVAAAAGEAALSPDGKVLAVVAFGEVFVRGLEDKSPTLRVTANHAREKHVAWSPDGLRLFFVSDESGSDSLYAATVATTRKELREAYEQALNPEEGEEEEEEEEKKKKKNAEADESEAPAEDETADETGGNEEEDPQKQESQASDEDEDEESSEDSGERAARWQDAIEVAIEPVLVTPHADRRPVPSPDGTQLLFRRDLGDVAVLSLDGGNVRVLSPGWNLGSGYRWSGDGHHVAFDRSDRNYNRDVWIARADGTTPPVNVSRHPDDDFAPHWSADGKVLVFTSERHDEQNDVYVVFLDKELEARSPLELEQYFEERGKAAKKRKPLDPPPPEKGPEKAAEKAAEKGAEKADDETEETAETESPADAAEIPQYDLEDAYLRLRRLTTDEGDETAVALTPAGDRVVISDGDGLHSLRWDGKERKKVRGAAAVAGLTLDGSKVVVVAGGRAGTVGTEGGSEKNYALAATIELEHTLFAEQKFREAARVIGEVFYHPTMKGLDWEALTERYLGLARRARNAADFDFVAARLLGELNASHLGVRSPRPTREARRANGRIGIDAEPVQGGAAGWRVVHVVPDGPAAKGAMRLLQGDVIRAVDGAQLDAATDLEQHLRGTSGKDVLLDVQRVLEGAEPLALRVLLTPISSRAERALRYREWVEGNARRAAEWSNGRLGYIHIRGMSAGPLRDFERDLYAAAQGRDGLLVDVRNNGGGYTADLVLASIMVRPHAYTVPRGGDPEMKAGYPQGRLFIQRYTMPMNMLCNEKSFSNAEIVSHAFKTLGRGTLVGQQTYGGVISTGGYMLLDGTWVRTPGRGWFLPDGTDMENNGALPDRLVPQTPESEVAGEDPQLWTAVQDLLERLDGR